jgi:serine/threonine protein kinase
VEFIAFHYSEVGTKLYIAPEVQSRRRGVRNHAKADLYSLGVRLPSFSPINSERKGT